MLLHRLGNLVIIVVMVGKRARSEPVFMHIPETLIHGYVEEP